MLAKDIQIRDPFVLPFDNKYYLFGSTDKDIWYSYGVGFDGYVSEDLIDWQGPYPVFRPSEEFWGKKNFWAPEVFLYHGAFYMFASFMGEKTNRGTSILRAESPLGPFVSWSGEAVTPKEWMCLDGTLFVDENNDPWIVFCHEWIQRGGDGTICTMRLTEDLKKSMGEPIVLFKSSSAPWSKKAFSPSNNIEGYVTDGCFIHRTKRGKLLMLWSCFAEGGYCTCFARSTTNTIQGPWEQAYPLFERDGGHGMIFRDFDDRLHLTIHSPNKTPYERAVFTRIIENEKGISIK